jgi:hypothetical protein
MTDRPHAKLAADTWRMIRALGNPTATTALVLERMLQRDEDFHEAAEHLIELACDRAVAACQSEGTFESLSERKRKAVQRGQDPMSVYERKPPDD